MQKYRLKYHSFIGIIESEPKLISVYLLYSKLCIIYLNGGDPWALLMKRETI